MEERTDERTFEQSLEKAINSHSMEDGSNTPDFILAQYLADCLVSFNNAINNIAKGEDYHENYIMDSFDCLELALENRAAWTKMNQK